jgi:NitT/TauT family transport system ATP-binding protein
MAITLDEVSFRYDRNHNSQFVFENMSLEVAGNEFLVLLGPTGCGKSTLLRLVAGFDRPTAGRVQVDGRTVLGPGPDRGMVFQDFDSALFQWLTVRENVEFGLRLAGTPPAERRDKAEEALQMVSLTIQAEKFPDELSGGMKQRVQIARMLAARPSIMLMDEPFAALDAQTRQLLQTQLVSIWADIRGSAIYVTHDIREALNLGQRIVVMTAGPSASIKRHYQIQLPYPRNQFDPAYIDLLSAITLDIEDEVTRAWK